MIENYVLNRAEQLLTLVKPDGKPVALAMGSVVSADVLDIIESGMVTLRITPPVGQGAGAQPPGDSTTQGKVITAQLNNSLSANIPMNEGDRISLQVLGGDKDLTLRFLGVERAQTTLPKMQVDVLQQRIQSLLSNVSGARLTSADIQNLKTVLSSVPAGVKNSIPEFGQLEKLMPAIEQMNGQSLQTSVESSGVLLETRLKFAAIAELKNSPDVLQAKDTLSNSINDLTKALGGIHDLYSQCEFCLSDPLQGGLLAGEIAQSAGVPAQVKGGDTTKPDAPTIDGNTLKEALSKIVLGSDEGLQKINTLSLQNMGPNSGIKSILGQVQQSVDDTLATLRNSKVSDGVNVIHYSKIEDTLQAIKQNLGNAQNTIDSLKDDPHKALFNYSDDQKALLLRLKDSLLHDKTSDIAKLSPARQEEISNAVDKLVNNIEHFQANSKANDMVYTFLPFAWKELKDGEFIFKKNKYNTKKSYTCDINLDLDKMGKLSISTTVSDNTFFISFNAEKAQTRDAIAGNRSELEKRFADAGLALSAMNIGLKQNIDFKEKKVEKGLNLKV